MEQIPSLGAIVYLILTFVLPGFCYVLVSAWCFHGKIPGGSIQELSSGGWTLVAVIGGLLLSSVCFALESICPRRLVDWAFPTMDLDRMTEVETKGKGTFYLQVLSGSAIMHFNIASGIFLIWIGYLGVDLYQGTLNVEFLLTSGLIAILVLANLRASCLLRRRFQVASAAAVRVP